MSLSLELAGVGVCVPCSHMQMDAVNVLLLFLDMVVSLVSVAAHRVTAASRPEGNHGPRSRQHRVQAGRGEASMLFRPTRTSPGETVVHLQ